MRKGEWESVGGGCWRMRVRGGRKDIVGLQGGMKEKGRKGRGEWRGKERGRKGTVRKNEVKKVKM